MIGIDIAKNAVLAVPPVRALRDKRRFSHGYDSEKDRREYIERVYSAHASTWATVTETGRPPSDVLEIGPGGNVDVARCFLTAGSRSATCVDVVPWAEPSDDVQYLCPAAIETLDLPSASFDFIYSHAVMEHVADSEAAIASITRLLRPGGVTSHQIDLRDHRDFSRPLDFLRHSDRVWRLATSHHLSPTNRWRASDFCSAFERHGLEVLIERPNMWAEVTDEQRSRLAEPFRHKELADLRVTSALFAARKLVST